MAEQQCADQVEHAGDAADQVEQHGDRVLIAIDDSDNAESAFDYYVKNIHKADAELIVLHVSGQVKMPTYVLFSGMRYEGMGWSPEEMRAMVEELRQKNKCLENKYNTKCNELQLKHRVVIVSQDPGGDGHAVCEYAKKHKANMIVVGSRGLGVLRRTILGSVSTYIVHHSHIPTLVCPCEKH